MEKRVLIAVVLSIAVLYGYSWFMPAPPKQQGNVPKETAVQQAVAPAPVNPAPTSPVPATAGTEREVTVETDYMTAVLTTRGAGIKKVVLKQYKDSAGAAGKPVAIVRELSGSTLASAATGFDIPSDPVFTVTGDSLVVSGDETRELVFTYVSPQGLVLKKIFTFKGAAYGIQVREQVENSGGARQSGNLRLILTSRIDTAEEGKSYGTYGAVTYAEEKLLSDTVKDISKGAKSYSQSVLWTGFQDTYFVTAILSQNGSIGTVQLQRAPADHIQNVVTSPLLTLNPGESAAVSYKAYLGPKDLDILKAQGNRLEEVIDFGWFSSLAKPLLYAMKYFYNYTGNYGVAIIIITVILKLLFFPLTHKSYKSMKEMQKIQPKMNELREKYKNDRDAMNRAVMELYKTHKVNPLGGCLPMLVQIPVFFALYKALMYSIELRHAPFMLWIVDLSAKDPYYVTPIIMGVTMFIQQKMTPTNMDPMQAKIMLALPVVFTFMFLNFPSGLVLYWLVNNVLTIAQQAYINKSLGTAEA
ncbi:membrane protein insertase YidC [Geobacter sp. DSM 9736]|uniref:membrane protein insertase YidC n=1 Tax=Geobacter sp. DSM 9736 TaxID=1277350 RepID=UPI000B511336|nr:membrane protein insertase YidC [Geobacter sp. DSM 9736]SNB47288.1 protein translocase subunit yidC [Geobacter sp. DSM 9736]